jgi:hypothetical protein
MLISLALGVLGASPSSGDTPCCSFLDDPGYVLHEWGTFTTLAGSDGVLLEGLTYDDHQLPSFVHQRSTSPAGFDGVRCKMETPVIYFYSDRERELSLKVGFQQGILTQWYPEVRELHPPVGPEALVLRGGVLDWGRITVLAPGRGTGDLPAFGGAVHWQHARDVDANVIARRGTNEFERFVFYRGLGSFALPLGSWIDEKGALNLVNNALDPLTGAIVLARRGKSLRAQRLEALAPGATTRVREPELPEIDLPALMALTARLLEEQGLYAREATAMVNTWRESYFESDGLRVLYPLPRPLTDWLLPLYVSPAPCESVRVLVGRLDVLSREAEQQALATVARMQSVEDAERHFGRFALPIVKRLLVLADEGRERDHVRELAELLEQSF